MNKKRPSKRVFPPRKRSADRHVHRARRARRDLKQAEARNAKMAEERDEIAQELTAAKQQALAFGIDRFDRSDEAGRSARRDDRQAQSSRAARIFSWHSLSVLKAKIGRRKFNLSSLFRSSNKRKNAQNNDLLSLIRKLPLRVEGTLENEYITKGLDRIDNDFLLYRILGNDLVPRHKRGQVFENLRFILENEPPLNDCRKYWVVNRIVDQNEEKKIISLLEKHGQEYLHLPFIADEYRNIILDIGCLPDPQFLASEDYSALPPDAKIRLLLALFRLKINYVMNNNGARNAALWDGRAKAKWLLPWDGNCFVTCKAWRDITRAVNARPHVKYFIVPIERILKNSDLLHDDFVPNPKDEPQVVFRSDSEEEFNTDFPYGRRSKVEFLRRLGVPGNWNHWRNDPWDLMPPKSSWEYGQFAGAGWVARLFSGNRLAEQDIRQRGTARDMAIIKLIMLVDEIHLTTDFSKQHCMFLSESSFQSSAFDMMATHGEHYERLIEDIVDITKKLDIRKRAD